MRINPKATAALASVVFLASGGGIAYAADGCPGMGGGAPSTGTTTTPMTTTTTTTTAATTTTASSDIARKHEVKRHATRHAGRL